MKIDCFGLFLVIFISVCISTGCQNTGALRTGEVDVYKAVNDNPLGDRRERTKYLVLEPRGYAASERSNGISRTSEEDALVTSKDLEGYVDELLFVSRRSMVWMEGEGRRNTSDYEALRGVVDKLEVKQGEMGLRFRKEDYSSHSLVVEFRREIVSSRRYLEALSGLVEYEKGREADDVAPLFNKFIFEIMGEPLLSGDYARGEPDLPNKSYGYCLLPGYRDKVFSSIGEDVVELVGGDNSKIWKYFENYIIVNESMLELCLFLSKKVEKSMEEKQKKDFKVLRSGDGAKAVGDLELGLGKAMVLNDLLTQGLFDIASSSEINREKSLIISELEREVAALRNVSNTGMFRKFESGDDEQGYIAIVLKELYVRTVQEDGWVGRKNPARRTEQKGSEILITATVMSESNVGDEAQTYPIVFEEDFAPGHFLNRKDRYIYGPVPYNGEAFDVNFSILELDDLKNNAILSGFSALSSSIGKYNPEYAVISPAVTALFGGILNGATESDKELDVSFTLAGEQDPRKSDVDFLLTETGHYVVIKTENPERNLEKLSRGEKIENRKINRRNRSADRQLYRDLVYNPFDSKLYWREDYKNLENNFKPENLFLSQTYAVFAITDENSKRDNLGDLMRSQVNRLLGERMARTFLPSESEIAQMIATFDPSFDESGESVQLEKREGFGLLAQNFVDELWVTESPYRRQFIAETLYKHADTNARTAFGREPDSWKTGNWFFDEKDGFIKISAKTELDNYFMDLSVGDEGPVVSPRGFDLFQDQVDATGMSFFALDDEGKRFKGVHGGVVFEGRVEGVGFDDGIDTEYIEFVALGGEDLSRKFSRKYYFRTKKPEVPEIVSGIGVRKEDLVVEDEENMVIKFDKEPYLFEVSGCSVNQIDSEELKYSIKIDDGRKEFSFKFVDKVYENIAESRFVGKRQTAGRIMEN